MVDHKQFTTNAKKQLFFVYGYAQSGSGSLTFPEDFDFVGIVESESDAKKLVKKLNDEILKEAGITPSEDEDDEDQYDDMDSDEYRYEYDKLEVLRLKK